MTTIEQVPPRQSGKRGLRRGAHHPEMMLSNFRAQPPTPPPPTGDVSHGITSWGMDGNDKYGCCGPAATDHYQVAKSGQTSQINTLGGVGPVALYFQYGTAQGEPGPNPDQGVDNPTWLTFLFNKGVIEAWAQVPSDPNEIHSAMLNFSGVLIGVDLTDDAEQLFNNHQPWTLSGGESPDPNEGHDILLVTYDDQGDDTFVTWGALQKSTVQWDAGCIQGAYVIVTSDDATRNGVDLVALKAQCASLGGQG